jgi:probable phosphoglycerate mutase
MTYKTDTDSPQPLETLQNRYFLMRHGKSVANEEGIIISLIENGRSQYGLCEAGKEQISKSLQNQSFLDSDTIIVSSDFLRTKESAQLAAKILKTDAPKSSPLLRERFFGDYEKMGDSRYKLVWEKDKDNDENTCMNVESPKSVLGRFQSFIQEMESLYTHKKILILSHGDILQIGLTWPAGIAANQHRSLNHLETAEIRPFIIPGK